MMMYDDLIKQLRYCASATTCRHCPWRSECCLRDAQRKAADAIEELSRRVPPIPHGRLIDADALTGQMERNLWAIEDKAEKELGFDETLRRGMQYGHAACLNSVNDATVIFVPQIVHCCECEYNNHCLTQEFVEDASKIPFDKNTWFCADAKAAPIIPAEEGEK